MQKRFGTADSTPKGCGKIGMPYGIYTGIKDVGNYLFEKTVLRSSTYYTERTRIIQMIRVKS